jgi:hypothetical protein
MDLSCFEFGTVHYKLKGYEYQYTKPEQQKCAGRSGGN